MPRLRDVSGEQAVTALGRLGFEPVRQSGSHVALQRILLDGRVVGCIIPMHPTLAIGTLHSILRQADITPDQFARALRKRW